MENIIKNPGLQHIAENVFLNLNYEKLETCRLVNEFCKEILDNPMFWLKKFIQRGLSKKNQIDWMAAIQITPYYNLETNILNYLKQSSKNERVIDIPCHINEEILSEYSEKIMELKEVVDNLIMEQLYREIQSGNDDAVRFQILALFMDNYNALNRQVNDGGTPIHWAVLKGCKEIVKILVPFTDNLNAPNGFGGTPIYLAANYGYKEIVTILAPMTDNPNAPIKFGWTPIHVAVYHGQTEIVQILAPLIENPNAPNRHGITPIYLAASKGLTEMVKILAPLTNNPNVLNKYEGYTPMQIARMYGHLEIVRILESFQKSAKRPRITYDRK